MRRYHKLIAAVAMKTAQRWGEQSVQTVEDMVQETYLKLCADHCRILREFQPNAPNAIYGFLKVVTANVVNDHFRRANAEKRGGNAMIQEHRDWSVPARQDAGVCPDLDREVLLQQLDARLRILAAGPNQERDRMIFWLHHRHGLTASAIAALPCVGLTTKGVESVLHRLTEGLRRDLQPPPSGPAG